jgi:NADH-quinone oxidoreductase subunit M
MYEQLPRILVLLLVLMPLASAALVPLFGRAARRASLSLAILHLGITAAVIISAVGVLEDRDRTSWIRPVFVPGSEIGSSDRTTWTLLSLSAATTPSGKAGPNVQFYVGVDGVNIWLVALASFMLIPAILVSWESGGERPGAFYGWMFLLQGGAIGAFLSFDVILFYIFFELTLIPAFFLIGRWGTGSGRRDAARKFFLYTLAGSLLTLLGIIGVVLTNPTPDGTITFSLPDLTVYVNQNLARASGDSLAEKQNTQFWLFLALMAGFMVKVPVWPFHTWLPSAYGESPTGVTILLSALLAKLGTFGILRFVLPLTPDAAILYGLPVVGTLAAFGIVYAALCAYDQKDMKLVIAYSSVSHLGFLVLGLFAFNAEGLSGAVLHMVNHGLTTGALFALLGFLLDRYRTTQVSQYGGLMGRFPNFAVLAFVLFLASIGLPGLNNFVSEMLMLAGLFDAGNPRVHRLGLAVVAAFGILLSAWYILTMLQKVFFNPLKEPEASATVPTPPRDVSRREFAAFGSLAGLCLLLGLYPQPILDSVRWDVEQLSLIGKAARDRVSGVPRPDPPPEVQPGAPPPGPGAPKGKGKGKIAEDE